MVCPSYKKRRPSSKAPASKNICDYKEQRDLMFLYFIVLSQTNEVNFGSS